MNYKAIYTTQQSPTAAAADLQNQLKGFSPKMIVFFASSVINPQGISKEIANAFPDCEVIGCSTSGELVSGQMLDNCISAMAFGDHAVANIKVEVLTNITTDDNAVSKAFESFEKYYNTPMDSLDPSKYVGFVFIDGMSGCEERINEQIGDLTDVTFIGGSAGDDLKFKSTYVYANGQAYKDAALLVLFKPAAKFGFLKTQSFVSSGKILKVTKTNESKREIVEFNNKPATQAYAEALGVPIDKLGDHLFKNPLGLMFGESPFVRSPRVIENNSVLFYCSVKKDIELSLLNSTDIINDTARAIEEKRKEMGGISAIINFNCILRTLDLKQQNRTKEYGALFSSIPTAGFSTYGESFIGHINQTATMLVLKD
jgi:hypothetical protein